MWLGQNSLILKGTHIGSGSILSANAVVSGKRLPSNTSYAGNPARLIKKGVFFLNDSVHNYNKEMTIQSMSIDSEEYIYSSEKGIINTANLFNPLTELLTAEEKLTLLRKVVVSNKNHNRFAIILRENTIVQRIKKRLKK